MKRTVKYIALIAAVVVTVAAIWKVLDFAARLPPGAYTDQYPNLTKRLIQAVSAGPGTYDLFSVYGDVSAVCISFAGIDPRQLAANLLDKNLVELRGGQPFFTVEGVATLIVFDERGGFQIEEIDKDVLLFSADGPIQNNTCVNRPHVARILVEPALRGESLARLTAKIDLR